MVAGESAGEGEAEQVGLEGVPTTDAVEGVSDRMDED
jgi:hypothetical protein